MFILFFRGQFSDDKPTAVDDAIEIMTNSEKLSDASVSSLPPLLTTLTEYRHIKNEINNMKTKTVMDVQK